MAIISLAQSNLLNARVIEAVSEVNAINSKISALNIKLNSFNVATDAKIAILTAQIQDLTSDKPDLQGLNGGNVQDYIDEDIADVTNLLTKYENKKSSLENKKISKANTTDAKIASLNGDKNIILLELYGSNPVGSDIDYIIDTYGSIPAGATASYDGGLFYNFFEYTGNELLPEYLVV